MGIRGSPGPSSGLRVSSWINSQSSTDHCPDQGGWPAGCQHLLSGGVVATAQDRCELVFYSAWSAEPSPSAFWTVSSIMGLVSVQHPGHS